MGVHGLWKLIESSGNPVPLETLENKVLAVDVSIWLYQLVKGFQEKAGQSVSNAFLLGLFHRICKLLFYRIKPIFVFDGGVPALKRMTIAARQNNRSKAEVLGEKLRMNLLENFAKQEALGKALGESFVLPKMFQPKQDTLFKLPPLPTSEEVDEEDDSDSETEQESFRYKDLHSIDINSEEFLSLPSDMRHDILTELKETRKQNSWAKLHLMPEEGSEFSNFQMSRLLKRRAIQVGIEQAEGEMGTRGFTISDLQTILSEQGVELAQRIAADNTTKLLYTDYMNNGSKPLKSRNIKVSSKEKKKSDYEDFPKEDDADWSVKTDNGPKNDCLTQNEILEIIKMENSIPSDLKAGESKIEDLPAHLDLKNDFVKIEVEKESEVNDQVGENTSRNNEAKLEHGTLPQSSSHCQFSSLPSTSSHLVFISDPQSEKPKAYENEANFNNCIENSPQFSTFHKINDLALSSDKGISSDAADKYLKYEIIKDNNELVLEDLSNANNSSLHNIKETCQMSVSSDDSDDFIEIDNKNDLEVTTGDSSSLIPDIPRKMECSSHLIPSEIIIDSLAEPEDDMFFDVFGNKSESGNKANSGFESDKKQLENKIQNLSDEIVLAGIVPTDPCSISNKEKIVLTGKNVIESNVREDNRKSVPQLSIDEIIKMKRDLERESDYLRSETIREDRIASTITEQIRLDAQELLQLFGIPYIIAPMEAEAQCAYLDLSNQTQGTITDDSDVWLFGAKNVYKNFFDQKKFVQQFKSTDISRCFHMGRDEMIMLALLSGSDYTTGLTGVGAVTALEVIAYFPKTEKEATVFQRLSHFADDYKQLKLKANISSKLKKISISEGFPSVDVIKAYMEPLVDQNMDPFSWSKPNLGGLRRYAQEKFGWDETRTNKVLQPILENLSRTESQGTLHRYFEWKFDGIENQMSKRVGKAVMLMKTPSLLDNLPSTSKAKRNISTNPNSKPSQIESNLMVKSKTPAQIARERAAKKVKELRKLGKFGPKFKNKKEK